MQLLIVIELSEILRNLFIRTQNEKIKYVNFFIIIINFLHLFHPI